MPSSASEGAAEAGAAPDDTGSAGVSATNGEAARRSRRPVRVIRWLGRLAVRASRHNSLRQLTLLACYLGAGVGVTWPRWNYLIHGWLPDNRDAAQYVWGFWWMAHQVETLGNPWFTHSMAAPAGVQLGFHTLLPLEGLIFTPVTLIWGPAVSANLLVVLMPGLMSYAMYRAARLWIASPTGAIAAGALYGLSGMLDWRAWYQVNLAVGAMFLPLALAAAIQLRRKPGWRRALVLGAVLGADLLSDQESTVLASVLVALILVPWLAWHPAWAKARAAGVAALTAVVIGGPQIVAMIWQAATVGTAGPTALGGSYDRFGSGIEGMFGPAPQVARYGLSPLGADYYRDGVAYVTDKYSLTLALNKYHHIILSSEPSTMFGLALTLLAVFGLAVSWRRRHAWKLALLWLGGAALALGPLLWIGTHPYAPFKTTLNGALVSRLMPYTWFVQIPGFSGFREAGRLAELGLIGASLLAGAAVAWLARHLRRWPVRVPVLAVVAAAVFLEAGWGGNLPASVMPTQYQLASMHTALPDLDSPIAADHSSSLVVDYPFGLGGGSGGLWSGPIPPESLVLATADGHPRAVGYVSQVPYTTRNELQRHPFFSDLVAIDQKKYKTISDEAAATASSDAKTMDIGWFVWWPQVHGPTGQQTVYWNPKVFSYLTATGFKLDYSCDGVRVYRLAGSFTPGPAGCDAGT